MDGLIGTFNPWRGQSLVDDAVDAGDDNEVGLSCQKLVDEESFCSALFELELASPNHCLMMKIVSDVRITKKQNLCHFRLRLRCELESLKLLNARSTTRLIRGVGFAGLF